MEGTKRVVPGEICAKCFEKSNHHQEIVWNTKGMKESIAHSTRYGKLTTVRKYIALLANIMLNELDSNIRYRLQSKEPDDDWHP